MYAVIEYLSDKNEACICAVWVKRTLKSAEKLALQIHDDQYLDDRYGYETIKDANIFLKGVKKGLQKTGIISIQNWFVQIKQISGTA